MTNGSESGSVCGGPIAFPILLECDFCGRVLWMSHRARLALGNPEHLLEISRMCYWRVWESPSSVLIGILATEGQAFEIDELRALESSILRHFFRLLRSQRVLTAHARHNRGHSGYNAVRQVERERQRLGRELHTGVGQMLAAIRLQLEVIARELPSPPNTVAQALSRISILAAQTLEQVRGISQRLHPPDWQRLTLESALRQLWEISGIPERFQAVLHIDPLPSEPELEVKTLIYRAFQEALSNLARHSGASRIEAALWWHGETLTLSIRDNGVGFDVARTLTSPASVAAGIGLRSIREATEGLDGKFYVTSGPDGTILEVSVAFAPVQR